MLSIRDKLLETYSESKMKKEKVILRFSVPTRLVT